MGGDGLAQYSNGDEYLQTIVITSNVTADIKHLTRSRVLGVKQANCSPNSTIYFLEYTIQTILFYFLLCLQHLRNIQSYLNVKDANRLSANEE